jgi:hypothetical protein
VEQKHDDDVVLLSVLFEGFTGADVGKNSCAKKADPDDFLCKPNF